MIVYFSATGNSKYAAERIAAATNDTAVSIEGHNGVISLAGSGSLGIVTPVYCWELPVIMREFLKKLKLTADGKPYIFIVTTYGTTPGCTCVEAGKLLAGKGFELTAGFNIRMPDTWTPVFDLSDTAAVAEQNAAAEEQIDAVIGGIKDRKAGNMMRNATPYAVRVFSDAFYEFARRTKRFYAEDTCIGCGLCAGKCPAKAIEMRDKKPVWIKKKCVLCLRCLHCCPSFAIVYGNGNTKKHGQYRNPNVKI